MAKSDLSSPNPMLKDLEVLVGKWELELSNASFLPNPSATVKGNVSFDWLEGGAFLIIRMGGQPSGTPSATWLIHRDDSSAAYKVFYYDDRTVSRIYEMSFSDNVWKLWRHSPDFSQRFEGNISEDGNKILAEWQKSNDGQKWEHDFDVAYTRLK